jgi:replicative DNA helicase
LTVTIDQQFSYEGEQRAIGLVLLRPVTWEVFGKLTPDDFFDDTNALIWDAITTLKTAKLPCELPSVFLQLSSQLGGTSVPRAVELRNYMTECVKSVVTVTGYQDTAKLLQEMANKRREARCIVNYARRLSTSGPADTASMIAQDMIRQLQVDQGESGSLIDAGDIIQNIYDKRMDAVRVTSTGFPRLDNAWDGGLVESFYYIVAARKKSFKTTLLTSLSYQVMMRDNPEAIDYYCLESTAEQVFQKMLSRWISEVWCVENEPRGFLMNANGFRDRNLIRMPWFGEALMAAKRFFQERGLRFMARPRMNLDDLSSEITSAGLSGAVRGIIVDYAQLVRTPLSVKGMMTEHLDNVHQTLAELAANNPLWVLSAVQLNQTGGVRGGEGANAAANMVMHMHKVWMNEDSPHQPRKYGAWMEMVDTRYTEEMNVGDDGKPVEDGSDEYNPPPAYHLDGDVGPCLREQVSPEVLHREASEVHPRNDNRHNSRNRR